MCAQKTKPPNGSDDSQVVKLIDLNWLSFLKLYRSPGSPGGLPGKGSTPLDILVLLGAPSNANFSPEFIVKNWSIKIYIALFYREVNMVYLF